MQSAHLKWFGVEIFMVFMWNALESFDVKRHLESKKE